MKCLNFESTKTYRTKTKFEKTADKKKTATWEAAQLESFLAVLFSFQSMSELGSVVSYYINLLET